MYPMFVEIPAVILGESVQMTQETNHFQDDALYQSLFLRSAGAAASSGAHVYRGFKLTTSKDFIFHYDERPG